MRSIDCDIDLDVRKWHQDCTRIDTTLAFFFFFKSTSFQNPKKKPQNKWPINKSRICFLALSLVVQTPALKWGLISKSRLQPQSRHKTDDDVRRKRAPNKRPVYQTCERLLLRLSQVRHGHPVQRPLSVGKPPRQRCVPPPAGRRWNEHPLQPLQRRLEVGGANRDATSAWSSGRKLSLILEEKRQISFNIIELNGSVI